VASDNRLLGLCRPFTSTSSRPFRPSGWMIWASRQASEASEKCQVRHAQSPPYEPTAVARPSRLTRRRQPKCSMLCLFRMKRRLRLRSDHKGENFKRSRGRSSVCRPPLCWRGVIARDRAACDTPQDQVMVTDRSLHLEILHGVISARSAIQLANART